MEILEDISLTSLSETYLERKRFYSVGSEDSATETEAGVAAKSKSRLAAKRGKAHTLTSARVDLRECVVRGRGASRLLFKGGPSASRRSLGV
ncbi:unnamed protein product [Euphydryas editha]|uniref:Uncharacterized protein n=1 Tax=Euphydryas editha TaxID=104508 RepID=A0AAU9V3P0_EUPED|nr:unnamed protein product [Euphydryas editha]